MTLYLKLPARLFFVMPASKSVFYLAVKIADDSTAESALQVNKLKISTKENDFTSAWQYNGSYLNYGGYSFWLLTIPTNNLPANDTLFMRYYVNDGDHSGNTEFPRNESLFYYKYFWSFIRKP